MELTDQEVAQIQECLEVLVDLSVMLPRKEVFTQVVADGGGTEVNGVYYGDDEASYFWHLDYLLKKFNVEYSILERYIK